MTIHFYTATHVSERLNGGDMYDQLLAEWLVNQGHKVLIISKATNIAYRYRGILVKPASFEVEKPDILFCRPQHYNYIAHKCKTRVVVQHNQSRDYSLSPDAPVIYVANHLSGMYRTKCSTVVHGINRYHLTNNKITGGTKIAAVNLNRNKSGTHFEKLCLAHPDKQFVGVKGYGAQHTPKLPNCEYREPDMDLRQVLYDCKAVVSFSESEGYPLLCHEVQSLGIPFIGTEIPGHKEAGCSAYILDRRNPPLQGPVKDVQPFDGGRLMWFLNRL